MTALDTVGKPRRVQLSRAKGWRMPENTIKVDRTTRWGNPFTVAECGSAEEAVNHFEHDILKASVFHPRDFEAHIAPLRGKNLACWCKLPEPGKRDICHAAVLLELANLPQHERGDG